MGPWKLPDLPEGPHKDLNRALHALRAEAGYPVVATIEEAVSALPVVERFKDCPPKISASTIHNAFASAKLPSYGRLVQIVRALGLAAERLKGTPDAAAAADDRVPEFTRLLESAMTGEHQPRWALPAGDALHQMYMISERAKREEQAIWEEGRVQWENLAGRARRQALITLLAVYDEAHDELTQTLQRIRARRQQLHSEFAGTGTVPAAQTPLTKQIHENRGYDDHQTAATSRSMEDYLCQPDAMTPFPSLAPHFPIHTLAEELAAADEPTVPMASMRRHQRKGWFDEDAPEPVVPRRGRRLNVVGRVIGRLSAYSRMP
ncbi:hypothetical protein CDO52_01720 [Nocardiopsis gilva YIM 90087]|uniref:Uncharacterized protein n=1 Tax=Nocardiopsis gilva YIM 90087 TaxID=1235441 RepID=A0A223S0L6_9ACTN|nr:hypothetical protein [Nocardiopsis gilva]ASU81682.1 hypothetical protein CDO52_01720 [Nocardiopsis gilva YIM 90087]